MFKKGHKHNKNWLKAVSKPRPAHVRIAISNAQRGRKHQQQEGFQKGHPPIAGTERTRFYKGQPAWNKGLGRGKDKMKLKYRTYKSNAKKRGFVFDVPLETFKAIIELPCAYCGEPSTGIDRIDNSLGYVDGNMAPACMICNHMKWNLTRDGFIERCKMVAKTAVGYEI